MALNKVDSAWTPLRQPAFRALWIATLVSNLGSWMQAVGAAWRMTSITSSALLVTMVQVASSAPVFLLGFPAGALADLTNRRRLLLLTQVLMLGAAFALSVAVFVGVMRLTI